MFRRFLMIWLILCTLGYGSVWAWDGHVDEADEHHKTGDAASHVQDADHPACDHCCHASAHIMALCPATLDSLQGYTAIGSTPYQQGILFHTTAPPDRPPQG